ncbi:hypothetical protein SynA1528_02355 [Synechococcus sp. A15-28]|nr:hypothetical protein SynA1528_02355 [Synechococcus sp. A15-28]
MGKHEGLNVALLVKKCYNQLIEIKDSSFRLIQTKYLLPSKPSLLGRSCLQLISSKFLSRLNR